MRIDDRTTGKGRKASGPEGALAASNGRIADAAGLLGVNRSAVRRRMGEHDLRRSALSGSAIHPVAPT